MQIWYIYGMNKTGSRPYLATLGQAVYAKRATVMVGEGRYRHVRSMRDTAQEIGISPSSLSRIERGAGLDLEAFRKLCVWLGISADELLGLK